MRNNLLAEWCFETPEDRDCAVLLFLTAMQRKLIADKEGCPGYGITSPTQSSGKTALLQLLSKLVWGRDLPVNSWAESDEEMAKLILAILLEGHPMVAFDNMPEGGAVSSQALSRVMTAAAFSGRVLGENRTAKAPTNVLVALTGNNLVTAGDFNSRLLMISLDTKMERPDQRKFERENLDLWAEEAREEFLGHALRILSYGIARGGHDKAESRFKEWNHLVYAPFLHAGGLSMGPIMERNIASDPALEARRGFLEAWFKCYGDESQQLAEVLKSCGFDRSHDGLMHEDDSPAFRDLKQATELVVPRGYPTPRNLGYALRSFKNKIIGGYVLRDSGREHKTTLWRVEKA
jgi:putative DNA primase/helicase